MVHPRKTFTPELSDEDIGGSVDIIDLADNAISICKITPQMMEKCDKSEKEKLEENDTVIQILKNRNYGDTGKKAYYKFDLETKRIYGVSNTVNYNFMPKNNLREEKESEQCPF